VASIKKLKSGMWQAQVFMQGVRASETKPTKTEVKDWAAAKEYEIKTSTLRLVSTSTSFTFEQAALRYEKEFSRGKKGVLWEQGQIKRLLKMPLAKLKLSDVSRDDIRSWRDSRLKSVQGSTVNREWNLLTHIFSTARDEWELISANPMNGVKKPQDNPARDRLVPPEEIERLGIAAGFDEEMVTSVYGKVYVAFLFAIETAMRMGEICNLELEMVDKEKRTASLPGRITKNGRRRDVALSTRAVELLELLPPTNQVCCFGTTSKQLDPMFRKLKNKAAIEGLHFHDTRHEAITRLAKKMPVLALARNVGHSNINQLMTYYNESAEDLALLLD
jgi:integrase